MKRRISLPFIMSLIMCCSVMVLAGVKTIDVKTPGTLAKKVGEKNKYKTTALKIKGDLNAADVKFLRDMAGGDSLFGSTPGKLTFIDLSEVAFVPGKESFLNSESGYRIKGRHSIPKVFLYNCPVEEVILPLKLDSVGSWAFAETNLRKLSIPEGVYVGHTVISEDSLLTELRLPAMKGEAVGPTRYKLPCIKKVIYGDVDYVPSGSFNNLPDLEEIEFEGLIGHMDGFQITDCPKLKRVIFRGPISSTGGAQFVKDCPELEEVRFDGLVFNTGFGKPVNCPKLKDYTQNGMVIYADTSVFHLSSPEDVKSDSDMLAQARRLLEYKTRTLTNPSENFLEQLEIRNYEGSEALAKAINDTDFISRTEEKVRPILADLEKTKLQLLKESPAYGKDDVEITWTYAAPSDSILVLDREYFNLDSIAGNGDDISRIKNLTYWVHDAVRHDGNSMNPQSISLIDLYEICKKEDRGVNCRMMAIMLTEALLAEGIPARYLTCQPKLWQYDSDCHVICMAWSESLGKWVWADPTFAAFVADENGEMLHPGEVRERLIDGRELRLNEDANWNHKSQQTKEHYLDWYMAKNLYYIKAITDNRPRPEGKNASESKHVILAPVGADKLPYNNIVTTDADTFWAKP